ncbi:MAG TPA: IS200/IS605 family transposase [Anaerolineales bacterium]|nr:IS200/IS605 family transposase [Anaerolineales bacterium]
MPDWRLYYHVVWGTKNRLALIDPAWEKDLYEYIWGRAVTLDCIPHAIGGMPDHVHVAISIPPSLSVASLIVQFKCASSHHVNQNYADGSFLWKADYRILSFSEKSLSTIVDYVNNQKKHHADKTLNMEMENVTPKMFKH